eukprot:349824-Chlamydomonas_euryale.AAC.16
MRCKLRRISDVRKLPLALRSLSRRAMVSWPASAGMGGCLAPGLSTSPTRLAHARPNTTMSSRLLAPRRLAPCTLALAASPAAIRPGTTASGLPGVGASTSPW